VSNRTGKNAIKNETVVCLFVCFCVYVGVCVGLFVCCLGCVDVLVSSFFFFFLGSNFVLDKIRDLNHRLRFSGHPCSNFVFSYEN